MSNATRREREIERIREKDPGFIPPATGRRRRKHGASFWMYVGVAVLIILLLIWISVAEFTGDTDVNLILPTAPGALQELSGIIPG